MSDWLQRHDALRLRGRSDSGFLLFGRAVTEGMALLVGLLAIESLFLGRGAYASLDLHPFWLPVILVSLQHGLYGGVATATLASLFMGWPPRPPGVDISTYNLEMTQLPIQWLVFAVLIGLYRQKERRQQAEQVKEIARLSHRNQVFADEIRRIDEELWRFEVAAATASSAESESQTAQDTRKGERDGRAPVSSRQGDSAHNPANELARIAAGLLSVVDARLFLRKASGEYLDVSEDGACAALGSVLGGDHPIVARAVELEIPVFVERTDGASGGVAAVAIRGQAAGAPRWG